MTFLAPLVCLYLLFSVGGDNNSSCYDTTCVVAVARRSVRRRALHSSRTLVSMRYLSVQLIVAFTMSNSLGSRSSSFGEIKAQLWQEALKRPASCHLRNSDMYVFIGVTRDAVEKVFPDTSQVEEVEELILPVVEVSEPKLERDRSRLKQQIREYTGLEMTFSFPPLIISS